jgi:hypothetical protein
MLTEIDRWLKTTEKSHGGDLGMENLKCTDYWRDLNKTDPYVLPSLLDESLKWILRMREELGKLEELHNLKLAFVTGLNSPEIFRELARTGSDDQSFEEVYDAAVELEGLYTLGPRGAVPERYPKMRESVEYTEESIFQIQEGRQQPNSRKMTCGTCNSPDHTFATCPDTRCFACGGYGHLSRHCSTNKGRSHVRPSNVNNGGPRRNNGYVEPSTLIATQKQVIDLQAELLQCKNDRLQAVQATVKTPVEDTVEAEFQTYSNGVQKNLSHQAISQEIVQEKDRSRSFMVFNLPEEEEDQDQLCSKVGEMLQELGENLKIEASRRGTPDDIKARPIKVILSSSVAVNRILSKAMRLRTSEKYKLVFIRHDRSRKERALHRLLAGELKKRRDEESPAVRECETEEDAESLQ